MLSTEQHTWADERWGVGRIHMDQKIDHFHGPFSADQLPNIKPCLWERLLYQQLDFASPLIFSANSWAMPSPE